MRPSGDVSKSNADGETAQIDADGQPSSLTHGSVDSFAEPMARVRPEAPEGAPLARARVLGAMFGDQSAAGAIGRFRVINRLGAGGMGVVYEAYDPDLARGVALKLINVAVKDRETALAEAKALARLSHPNVVPIYDVGLERDRVYLVMELVRGSTLRLWPEGRKLREILDVYQQAGRALSAAHDAGLVHRDFKPDNAIIGTDGRVRVVDFGLACEADEPERSTSERRRAAGTPRFMAPEIKAGAAVTPAADQYSFCVALADAVKLASEPTPRRIAAVIERGRSVDPAGRFASLTDLLRALARDPARTRRRIAAVGGLAASVGVIAFFLGRHPASEVADVCDDGAALLETTWSGTARSAALDRVATLSSHGQSLRPRLARDLDTYANSWAGENHAACRDRLRKAETDTMSDRRTICLQRGRDALAAVGELISNAVPENLVNLPRAVQSLPDPAICSNLDVLVSNIAPVPPVLAAPVSEVRRQITQARIEIGAGRYEQALSKARIAVADARPLGYGPALAEALLVQGLARMNMPDRGAAVPILAEATTIAMSSHDDALAIEAWARRAWAQGTSTDPDGAVAGFDVIEPLAKRTESATFERALLYNNLGSVELSKDRRNKAREYFERALTESQKITGPVALELIVIRENLAFVIDDRERADKLLVEVADELAERLGVDHPDALDARLLRGFVTIADLRKADALLTPVCRAYESHGILADRVVECWTEVGLVRLDLGERKGAIEAMERTVRAQSDMVEAAAYITLLRGDAQAAAQQFADAVAAHSPARDDQLWDRLSRAHLTLGLGWARREAGDLRGAREALEQVIVDFEELIREHPQESYERRLGRAHVELAFVLLSMNASWPETAPVGAAALEWLRHVHGRPDEIARLSMMLRSR